MSAADVQTLRDWLEVYEADAHVLETLDRLAVENERLWVALRDGMDCVVAYHGEPFPSDEEDHCAVCTWLRVAADLAGGVGDTAA